MSFGNSYNGGRTQMKTKVILNVYDLSPANEYLYPVGLGLHHCGVEINGIEYSYGSSTAGGGGIFEGPPKQVPNAKFRTSIDMGSYNGGSKELQMALDYLRSNGFDNHGYNLIRRNCNHFCNALIWRLLQTTIPSHINRLADIGNCCSCLLPKQLLEGSPVNGNGTSSSSRSFIVPTNASMNRGGMMAASSSSSSSTPAFTGKGMSLGGDSNNDGTATTSSGFLSSWSKASNTSSAGQTTDDLTDRREKARKAALARLERNNQQQQQG